MNLFEELERLRLKTPRLYNINIGSENSEYCTHSDKNKNCYLLFAANFNEQCMYGGILVNSRDCVDCDYCEFSELCYECLNLDHCYNCNFSQDLKDCSDCFFSYDCTGCKNCLACVGLRQKEYHVFNEPVSREEFKSRVKAIDLKDPHSISEITKQVEVLKQKTPIKFAHTVQSENCIGEFITRSKNCYFCFDAHDCEDCFYLQDVWRTKESMDTTFSDGSELLYECFSIGLGSYNCNFSNYIRTSSDCEYCELCFNCKHCFACIGLRNKEFHILNQPYEREEYFKKVAEIKTQMRADGTYGKHLPSTYKYEDTAAMWWR